MKKFRRIIVFTYAPKVEWELNKTRILPELEERARDYKTEFPDRFEDWIVLAAGETGWAIVFMQHTQDEPRWMVDIYVDDINKFATIVNEIELRKGDFIFNYLQNGPVSKYFDFYPETVEQDPAPDFH